jgi:hypothetical protein
MTKMTTIGLAAALACLGAASSSTLRAADQTSAFNPHAGHDAHKSPAPSSELVQRVRKATEQYRDIEKAKLAGYGQFLGCVAGPQGGAMGVHYVNGALLDATLNPDEPEALIYEFKDGQARLVGVEFITFAAAWDAAHPTDAPVLEGELLQFNGAPNRYRIDAFYELHVWAWRDNPTGTFADWNPHVSCDEVP